MNKNKSLDERLMNAQVAINNALENAQIKTYLEKYGYNDERLNKGMELFNTARTLQEKQKQEYGDQFELSEKLNKTVAEARKHYSKMRKIARVAFRDDAFVLKSLGILENTRSTLSGWLGQARQFYTVAVQKENILNGLSTYLITKEELETGNQAITEIEKLNVMQECEKSEAQQATLERDSSIDELERWLWDLQAIARIALEEKPQLLEMLSIVEPS